MIASIDVGKLIELVWAAALAGVAVAFCFALVLIGITRASDCRRNDRSVAASAYGVLTVVATAVFIGIAVFGISIIAS